MYKTEYYTQYPALLTFWRRHLGNKRYTYEVLEKKKTGGGTAFKAVFENGI